VTLQAQPTQSRSSPRRSDGESADALQLDPVRDRSGEPGRKIKVAQFGLGMIGIEALRLAATKPWIEVVGGVDIDPAKTGKPLIAFTGVNAHEPCKVFPTFDALLATARPDVVLHTAGSKVGETFNQIETMIRAGVSVASTCEEMLYPRLREPQRSIEFDGFCRRMGAGVVGTGVNPGFVMDVLPVCLTGVSRSVESIYVERVVNASTRRMQLQKKVGSGMEPEHFRELFRAGKAGHAGFRESAALICHCLGWKVEKITETCEPVIADHDIKTEFFSVKTGLTCGLHQIVEAHVTGPGAAVRTPLVMDLKMYLDANDPHDAVRIKGEPTLDVRLNGGVAGDHATVAALVNVIPRLLNAGGGLHLMTDLAVPSWK
jgi:2,4-diaminopentanoate dehydrogenase